MEEARGQRSEAEVATELVQRIHGGDAAAEGELVERYSPGLRFYLRRTTGDPALADDLHQETFRIVLERLRARGLGEPGRLAGFLRATGRNLARADHRKSARRKTDGAPGEVEAAADGAPSQLGLVLREERARMVRELLAELRADRDRQLLYRFYLAEEGKDEICADLGLSDLHFNRVLFRARQRFRELLERAERRRPGVSAGG